MALFFAFLICKLSPKNGEPLVDVEGVIAVLTVLLFGWCLLHKVLCLLHKVLA